VEEGPAQGDEVLAVERAKNNQDTQDHPAMAPKLGAMAQQEMPEDGQGERQGLEMDEQRGDGTGDRQEKGSTGACLEEGGVSGDGHCTQGDAEAGLPEPPRFEPEVGRCQNSDGKPRWEAEGAGQPQERQGGGHGAEQGMVDDEHPGVVGEKQAELESLDAERAEREGETAGEAMGRELMLVVGGEGDGEFEGFVPEPGRIARPEDGGDGRDQQGNNDNRWPGKVAWRGRGGSSRAARGYVRSVCRLGQFIQGRGGVHQGRIIEGGKGQSMGRRTGQTRLGL